MSDQSRRVVGAGLGLALGLLYGLVAGTMDSFMLPGVPLRVDTAEVIVNTLLAGLGAAAAGYVTAWSPSSLKGILGGAGAIALFNAARSFVVQAGAAQDLLLAFLSLLPFLLPSAAFALPITASLRLGVNWYGDALSHSGRPRLFRLGRLALGVIALGVFAGSLSQMSSDEQQALRQVNTMIQKGLTARSEADVPGPLRAVADFRARAGERYTLDWRVDLSADFTIAGSAAVQTIEVDVRFDTGLHFTCLIGETLAQPLCSEG
jgi:hypothetical protein